MAAVDICITMMSGEKVSVQVDESSTVRHVQQAAEAQLELEPHASLKLVCSGNVLLASMPVASLEDHSLFGTVTREQDVHILKQAASSYPGYADLMGNAAVELLEGAKTATTAALPTILDVLEQLAGERKQLPDLAQLEGGMLQFWGRNGELLMPPLRASPLQRALGVERLDEITITVTCNSDCYNQGLGVGVEASPLLNTTLDEKGIPSYMYNGFGLTSSFGDSGRVSARRNVIKFHPGMLGGALRVEGVGGWGNSDVGFRPASLREAEGALHTLRIILRTSGVNTVEFTGVQSGADETPAPVWTRDWNRELFDGDHIPLLFAFLDLGSTDQKGVVYGHISLQARATVC